MIVSVRRALSICLMGQFVAVAVMAQPVPAMSFSPSSIVLSPAPAPAFAARSYVINDAFGVPIPGATVAIDMSACVGLFPAPSPGPPTAVVCGGPGAAGNIATAVTNAAGVATFVVLGYTINPGGGAPGTVSGCATVTVTLPPFGPVVYPAINIAAADQNGAGGCNAADASLFLGDRDFPVSPKNQARSDFNGSGVVDPADGAIMLAFRDAGANMTVAACP